MRKLSRKIKQFNSNFPPRLFSFGFSSFLFYVIEKKVCSLFYKTFTFQSDILIKVNTNINFEYGNDFYDKGKIISLILTSLNI